MLNIINYQDALTLLRPAKQENISNLVKAIIEEVKNKGDDALYKFTRKFDGIALSRLQINQDILQQARIEKPMLEAIEQAIITLTLFHEAIRPASITVNTAPGILIKRVYNPINSVGLYVPGGKTPLVSSLLMQAIPAKVAGCPVKILCTPPDAEGNIDSHLLVAARLCGIDTIFSVGGAQAIAAMAYGTTSIPKVDKIFGPGNAYVTEAKIQVAFDPQGAAIDMPAGPSEVLILADEKANPDWVAADLLSQAEHGQDSQVILICESTLFAQRVNASLAQQSATLARKAIIEASLTKGISIICTDKMQQIKLINEYAPEHLIINRLDAEEYLAYIHAAGTIFVGPWAPETMGDYISGSNHVLPTYGFAKNYSGLGTSDFLLATNQQFISAEGISHLGAYAEKLAQLEGLSAHAQAVRYRLDALEDLS